MRTKLLIHSKDWILYYCLFLITEVDGFLDDEECDLLVDIARSKTFQPMRTQLNPLTLKHADKLFQQLDYNEDGFITYDEVCLFLIVNTLRSHLQRITFSILSLLRITKWKYLLPMLLPFERKSPFQLLSKIRPVKNYQKKVFVLRKLEISGKSVASKG